MLVNRSDNASIGIMQGRFTSSRGRGIQFFPFGEWEEEFEKATGLGLDEIDFIFDHDRYKENPLWSLEGVSRIISLSFKTRVGVRSICADFFMRRTPIDWPWTETTILLRNHLNRLIENAFCIGTKIIEIPLLSESSITEVGRRANFIGFLYPCLLTAKSVGINLAVETDLPPQDLLSLVSVFGRNVGVVYDTGNSVDWGYNPVEEIEMLGPHIVNVHIKDKILGQGTVPLGTGSVDFDAVFSSLNQVNYQGSFILQAARGMDGKEIETIRGQIDFLKEYLRKYGFIN